MAMVAAKLTVRPNEVQAVPDFNNGVWEKNAHPTLTTIYLPS